jgi:tryptophan synthase alpha subunit
MTVPTTGATISTEQALAADIFDPTTRAATTGVATRAAVGIAVADTAVADTAVADTVVVGTAVAEVTTNRHLQSSDFRHLDDPNFRQST